LYIWNTYISLPLLLFFREYIKIERYGTYILFSYCPICTCLHFSDLYWKNANAKGAAYGIICGFVLWAYTVIIPYMANIGILDNKIVLEGPYSIELLKPTALFGIENLGSWGHCFFWSLLTNIFVNSLFSLFTKQSDIELETSNIMC